MRKIKVGKEDIELNEEILNVNADNVNDFLTKYAGLYHYYSIKHNDASFIHKRYTDQFSATLNSKFKVYKEAGSCSDKLAEASSKCDDEVMGIQEKVRAAEYAREELYGYLKSLDYAHQDALQICYNLRKELDKIYGKTVSKLKIEDVFE
jgi:hypothetical protein